MSLSNRGAARSTRSMWPLVIGSKVPGYTAILFRAVVMPWLRRGWGTGACASVAATRGPVSARGRAPEQGVTCVAGPGFAVHAPARSRRDARLGRRFDIQPGVVAQPGREPGQCLVPQVPVERRVEEPPVEAPVHGRAPQVKPVGPQPGG